MTFAVALTEPTWIWTTIQIKSYRNRISFSCHMRLDFTFSPFFFPVQYLFSKVYLLSCAPHLLHEDSLQHHGRLPNHRLCPAFLSLRAPWLGLKTIPIVARHRESITFSTKEGSRTSLRESVGGSFIILAKVPAARASWLPLSTRPFFAV